MTITVTGVITGAAQTGLTSPTYTGSADTTVDTNAKASAITALGGTQAGVRTHSVSDPFTLLAVKPKVVRSLPQPNPITGRYGAVPSNEYMVKTTKGLIPALGVAPQPSVIETKMRIPAGADAYDLINFRAALSVHIGLLWAQASNLGDTAGNGLLG